MSEGGGGGGVGGGSGWGGGGEKTCTEALMANAVAGASGSRRPGKDNHACFQLESFLAHGTDYCFRSSPRKGFVVL